MSEIKVSVIVPVYDTDKHLDECIKSLVNQTLKDIEIIFVTKDNSSFTLKNYVQDDKRIILIERDNINKNEAYNVGIKIAKGEYLYFVNSDDLCAPDMLEKLYLRAKETDSDITTCQTALYDEITNTTNKNDKISALLGFPEEFFDKVFSPQETLDFIFCTGISPYNKIFKTSFLRTNSILFNQTDEFSSDAWFASEKLTLVKEFLYNKRLQDDTEIDFDDNFKQLNAIKSVLQKYNLYKKTKKAFKRFKAQTLLYNFCKIAKSKTKSVCLLKPVLKGYDCIFDLMGELLADFKFLIKLYFSKNRKILFWGASLYLEDFLSKYSINQNNILGIIDIAPQKNNTYINRYCCYTPDKIKELNPDEIIITIINGGNKRTKEIKKYLKENGLQYIKVYTLQSRLKEFYQKIKYTVRNFFATHFLNSLSNKRKVKQINEIINSISSQKKVYLFQYSFYEATGKKFFSGGAERYMIDLSNLISQLGYKPILIQAGDWNSEFPWLRTKGNLTIIGVNSFEKNFYKIINHLTEPTLAIYSGMIKWNTDIKYQNTLLISHGITWDSVKWNIHNENKTIKFLKSVLTRFRSIISVDTNTISWFRSTFSRYIFSNKIDFEYLPNYVDTAKFKPLITQNKQLKITFPRRCSTERGFWLFADIIPKLLENHNNILIEFVGYIHDGKINDKINTLLSKYPDNVTHRVVPQDKMYEVYQNTDISVIPTIYSEGTSLSCLEAMACGNAIVTTNIGGLPNLIINNHNGKLVNPDETSIYNAIEELINDTEKRNYLSQNAILVSKVFSKTYWNNSWLDILKKYLQ